MTVNVRVRVWVRVWVRVRSIHASQGLKVEHRIRSRVEVGGSAWTYKPEQVRDRGMGTGHRSGQYPEPGCKV